MVPWSITAVRNGDVQELSQAPYKPRAPERILSDAWTRHADSKSTVNGKARKPGLRQHIGLSRFQFGDGEYEASVAAFQRYHAKTPEEEDPVRPEMQGLRVRELRAGHLSSKHPSSMESLRRRHSSGGTLLSATGASSVGETETTETEAEVEAFSGSEESDNDDGRDGSPSGHVNGSGADEPDGLRGRDYGKPLALPPAPPAPPAGLLVPTVSAPTTHFQRRQSNASQHSFSSLAADAPQQRPVGLPMRFSLATGLPYEYGSGGGDVCDFGDGDDGDDGDDEAGSRDPSVRSALLAGRESAPGRPVSNLRQADGASRRSNGGIAVGGGGGGVPGGAPMVPPRAAARRASLCALALPPPPPPPLPSDADAPPALQTSQSSSPVIADAASSPDRVGQMLQDLRLAKRPEPPPVILGTLACAGNPRQQQQQQQQQRTQRAGEAAAAAAAAAAGGGRTRRCSGWAPGEVSDANVPRPVVSINPRRESRAAAAVNTTAAAAGTPSRFPTPVAVVGPPNSPVRAAAAEAQALRNSGGSLAAAWRPDDDLLDSTEDEVVLLRTHASAAAAAAGPNPPPAYGPAHPEVAAAAATVAQSCSSGALRSQQGIPVRSKSQVGVVQQQQSPTPSAAAAAAAATVPSRSSGCAPLGGWTGRPLAAAARQNLRQSTNGGGGAAAAASSAAGAAAPPYSVHFAADAVGPVSFRSGSGSESESSIGEDGVGRSGSGANGARFVWAARGSRSGGGTAGAAPAERATKAVVSALSSPDGSIGGGGHGTARPPAEQGAVVAPAPAAASAAAAAVSGRSVGRLLGGLFHGGGGGRVRRDSSGGLKPH
ncbi:hypothetical protein PLESTB_000939600 [Pleodorina starrii]|uniref:Uncharacterized protein n=1 Tax=Pleodorina starrii TaxID=330485 RepID=A0A9W6F3H3_9CHLO|nr:hypothetical protein PLESTM_000705600 [Pleodorina starrii]GLC55062.1 hypothetical protein PLESTB_000939600 [Pleodorina starrii]GLC71182.1 hypothetical protein PLESTF_001083200 [Pleodorina starrii]